MIKTGFFNSINGDRGYNADDMSDYFKGLLTDGVFKNYLQHRMGNTGNGDERFRRG